MIPILAEGAILVSIYKPIVLALTVGLWAKALPIVNRDVQTHRFNRDLWNGIHLAAGGVALIIWLVVPFFWLGFAIMVLFSMSSLVGYHLYRNATLPERFHWKFDLESIKENMKSKQQSKVNRSATVQFLDHDGKPVQSPGPDSPLAPIRETLEQILAAGLPRRANQIDLLADAKRTSVVTQIDGVKFPQTQLDPKIGLGVIDYLKLHGGMDVSDRRKKQTGKLTAHIREEYVLGLTTSGTTKGLSMQIEVNPGALKAIGYDELGLTSAQREKLDPFLDSDASKAVIVVCPPGQGMTTTLYALVGRHDPYTSNIMALEAEPERELEGVHEVAIRSGQDAPSLAQQLNALMLREPNIMMLDSLSDQAAAQIIPQFADQTRFYFGLRQADTFAAVKAWAAAIGDARAAADALGAVLSQRLVRKLCMNCRGAYKPDPAVLKKMNLPADKVNQLYKATGKVMVKDEPQTCPKCHGLGYLGRVAIFEVMVLDDEARGLLGDNQFDQARNHLRRKGMLYLQEAGLYRVVEGVTDIKEITRVLQGEK